MKHDFLPIDQILVTLAGPTLSILLDKMKNKKVGRVEILFKYIAGILCSYLAYRYGADIWVVAVISIASSDLVRYVASKEGLDAVKDSLLKIFGVK